MPKTTTKKTRPSSKNSRSKGPSPVVVSMGCPSGVGPEISLVAAFDSKTPAAVIVGDRGCLVDAAGALGMDAARVERIRPYKEGEGPFRGVRLFEVSQLTRAERRPGRPGGAAGRAQLEYVEEGYRLAAKNGWPLATAPVSKSIIARSGLRRASAFRGHTEWLEALDEAPHSVMCFASSRLVTALVTTHLPIRKVARAVTPELVTRATLELCDLLLRLGAQRPKVAVASLNPHAGEESLLGGEEKTAILPGILRAQEIARGKAIIVGPVGAETAYRKGASGTYDGVLAMYHDQATIPMKLLDFGGAVNVTQGLSIVRTSVDHGTAYDIAGKGIADARGMCEAMKLASRLGAAARKIPHGKW